MNLKWLGHSCFLLTSESGVRILMDPCAPKTGYTIAPVEADAVTASHDHYDHNYFDAALGDPVRITEPGVHEVKGVRITGIPTWHDKERGAKRGRNIMFLVEMDGIRLLHAGDLGHLPDEAAVRAVGQVDVLRAPIGGVYTIDGTEAKELARLLGLKEVVELGRATAGNINIMIVDASKAADDENAVKPEDLITEAEVVESGAAQESGDTDSARE